MANLKTSQFPAAGSLLGPELLGIVQDGGNYRTTLALVSTYVKSTVSLHPYATVTALAIGDGSSAGSATDGVALGAAAVTVSGTNPIAIGRTSSATGNSSIAIGYVATALALGTAVGNHAISKSGVAVGNYAQGLATHDTVVGIHAHVDINSNYATAIGYKAIITGSPFSVAIGYQAYVNDGSNYSVAIGCHAAGNGQGSIAIGTVSNANFHAIAMGTNSYATTYSIAIGGQASTQGYDVEVIGSVAIGYKAYAKFPAAVAIGLQALVSGKYGVSIGLNTISGKYGVAIGKNATSSGGFNGIAIGKGAAAAYDGAISIGEGSTATQNKAISIGYNSTSANQNAIAIGVAAHAPYIYGIAIGAVATTGADYGCAIGKYATATGISSIAIGPYAHATTHYSIALGQGASAPTVGSMAVTGYPGTFNEATFVPTEFSYKLIGTTSNDATAVVLTGDLNDPVVSNTPFMPSGAIGYLSGIIIGYQSNFVDDDTSPNDSATFTLSPVTVYRDATNTYKFLGTPTFTLLNSTSGGTTWTVPTLTTLDDGSDSLIEFNVADQGTGDIGWLGFFTIYSNSNQ